MPEENQNQSGNAGVAVASGQNTAGESPESRLQELLRQEFQDETTDTQGTPPAPSSAAPEETAAPIEAEIPGQTTSQSEETAQPETGEASDDQISTTDDTELNEALSSLNDDAKAKLIQMAKDVSEGKTTIGELKQGHRNMRKALQRIEELEAKLEGGEDTAAAAPVAPTVKIPPEVAKLKELHEVRQGEH